MEFFDKKDLPPGYSLCVVRRKTNVKLQLVKNVKLGFEVIKESEEISLLWKNPLFMKLIKENAQIMIHEASLFDENVNALLADENLLRRGTY